MSFLWIGLLPGAMFVFWGCVWCYLHVFLNQPWSNHVWMKHLLIIRFQPPKVLPLPNHFLPLSHWFVGSWPSWKIPRCHPGDEPKKIPKGHISKNESCINTGKKKKQTSNVCMIFIMICISILKYPKCYMIFRHQILSPSCKGSLKHHTQTASNWLLPAMKGFSRIPLPLFTAAIGASSPAKGWTPIRSIYNKGWLAIDF